MRSCAKLTGPSADMALSLSVEPGDRIRIGDSVITIEQKSGRKIRVRIESREDISHDQQPKDGPPNPPNPTRSPQGERMAPAGIKLSRPTILPSR